MTEIGDIASKRCTSWRDGWRENSEEN